MRKNQNSNQKFQLIGVLFKVDLYSGAIFIQQTLGWGLYSGVALLLLIALFFTALGLYNESNFDYVCLFITKESYHFISFEKCLSFHNSPKR